jgi:transcriptional/translational regulatory protein YebC/TACO1
MSDILNFNVSDEIVNNIVKNNSALINIKNSVGICTIRCGQNIEDCSDVILSTMTNYGKILVINPKKDNNEKATCSIQLPFDNNNDNTDTNGTSSYTFKKMSYIFFSFIFLYLTGLL